MEGGTTDDGTHTNHTVIYTNTKKVHATHALHVCNDKQFKHFMKFPNSCYCLGIITNSQYKNQIIYKIHTNTSTQVMCKILCTCTIIIYNDNNTANRTIHIQGRTVIHVRVHIQSKGDTVCCVSIESQGVMLQDAPTTTETSWSSRIIQKQTETVLIELME